MLEVLIHITPVNVHRADSYTCLHSRYIPISSGVTVYRVDRLRLNLREKCSKIGYCLQIITIIIIRFVKRQNVKRLPWR